ncbi:MAG: T9SS type A sorting domain-containing protein, partial [Flavobacteriales bacterium]|nr:T9SS type A sorting domain-containing protein [Flavobacteriales bacterium]
GALDGTATANVTGGIMPYTYVWNTADFTQTISGLVAAMYSVTVTDANGCNDTDSSEVSYPVSLAEQKYFEVISVQGNQVSARASSGTLDVFTILGAKVESIQVSSSDSGISLERGVYIVRYNSGDVIETKKVYISE